MGTSAYIIRFEDGDFAEANVYAEELRDTLLEVTSILLVFTR